MCVISKKKADVETDGRSIKSISDKVGHNKVKFENTNTELPSNLFHSRPLLFDTPYLYTVVNYCVMAIASTYNADGLLPEVVQSP